MVNVSPHHGFSLFLSRLISHRIPRDVCLLCTAVHRLILFECVCVLRNFVHGAVTCPGRPTGWTIDVTISCYTPTPTPQDGQSYVKLSTQWGGHVTAHCPPSGMANVTEHCPPSGMDGESNGENVGENVIHSLTKASSLS